jgi:hypothetical protein
MRSKYPVNARLLRVSQKIPWCNNVEVRNKTVTEKKQMSENNSKPIDAYGTSGTSPTTGPAATAANQDTPPVDNNGNARPTGNGNAAPVGRKRRCASGEDYIISVYINGRCFFCERRQQQGTGELSHAAQRL